LGFKSVVVKGLGKIKFPSEMSDKEIKKSLDNLDFSKAARMERAKEQGMFLNMPLYHGTGGDILEFDLSRGGSTSGSDVGKLGVSLGLEPDIANEFSTLAGKEGANVMPVYHSSKKGAMIELDGTEKTKEIESTILDAWDQGYDSILFKNYTTPKGEKGKSFVFVKDPKQIRSKHAMFHPDLKESPSVLGGVGAAAVGAGAFVGSEDSEASMAKPGSVSATISGKAKSDTGTIEGPKSPNILKVSNFIDKHDDIVFDDMLGGVTSWMNKLAYGDKIKFKDRLLAALDLI